MTDSRPATESALKLWIDGVGCWLVCLDDSVIIGNAIPLELRFKLSIVANLGTEHALIRRRDGVYDIESRRETAIDGVKLQSRQSLCHGSVIELGDDVRLRFTIPSPLSTTAVLTRESSHRFAGSVDGIVLLDQTCLLGPGSQSHIVCPSWSQDLVLFRRGDAIKCKAMSGEFQVNGVQSGAIADLCAGDHLSGPDWSLRAEDVARMM